jgi:hypothetical protein
VALDGKAVTVPQDGLTVPAGSHVITYDLT